MVRKVCKETGFKLNEIYRCFRPARPRAPASWPDCPNQLVAYRGAMSTHRPVLEQWIAQTIQSYPSAAVAFLSGESDPFRNPVGHTVRQCLTVLFDRLHGEIDPGCIAPALDALIRLRAVQDLTASQAVGFVFLLRPILRELWPKSGPTIFCGRWRAHTSAKGCWEMRVFLGKKGLSPATPDGRKKIKAYLLANLAHQRDDLNKWGAELSAKKISVYQLFKDRGISTDSNLYPDYTIELHLRQMMEKGLLTPSSVRRVAIVGPGLDFVNKSYGSDFYPPQTTQPFAVIDSLARLGFRPIRLRSKSTLST